jgi:hypothetical protein
VLDAHFPRHQQDQQLEKHRWLLLHHLVDCLAPSFPESPMHLRMVSALSS